jgi:hypothetical protein
LHKLSIETAIKLFDLKVSPTASYAIEVIWPFLTLRDFANLERVKTRYRRGSEHVVAIKTRDLEMS